MPVEIEIEVYCDVCGAKLDARLPYHSNDILVTPCEFCMSQNAEAAEQAGYEAGYQDGLNSGESS